MMAKMKKKEKILEAKLEFLREMRRLAEKSEMEGEKEAEGSDKIEGKNKSLQNGVIYFISSNPANPSD